MALFKYLSALLESRQKRINSNAVAHLSDHQLRDVGLYRVDNHVRPMTDPLALETELKQKQALALAELRASSTIKEPPCSVVEESKA